MGGIQNQPNIPGTQFQATARPIGAFNNVVEPAPTIPADQLLMGGATPPTSPAAPPQPAAPQTQDLTAWRNLLNGPSAIDAVMAISNLQAQAGSNRAAVVQLLMEAAQSPKKDQRVIAAMDALNAMGAREAAPMMQRMMADGDAAIAAAAHDTYLQLNAGQPQAPAAGALPPGQPTAPVAPGQPTPNVATQPVAPAPGLAPMTPELNALAQKFLEGTQAPQASVQLASLPTNQLAAIANRLVSSSAMDMNLKMVVAALQNRAADPLAQEVLRKYAMLPMDHYHMSACQAALALSGTLAKQPSPQNLAAILTCLAHPFYEGSDIKRVICDQLGKNPQALAQPATIATLAAILNDKMADPMLVGAASHALAQAHTPQARAYLCHSPLLKASLHDYQLRGLWDLQTQPGPYPEAQAELQELAKSVDQNVAKLAKALLAKKN